MTSCVSGPSRGPITEGTTCNVCLATDADVVGQHDLADVDLVSDDVDERPQRLGVGRRHGHRRQRLAHPPTVGLAHRQRRRAHVADLVHRPHERLVAGQVLGKRPVGEMRRRVRCGAMQAAVDLLGDERQQRRGDPDEHVEHRVQRVDGVAVAVPEALPAAPDVPVRQRLDERADRGARTEQVVGLHRPGDVLDEVTRLGDDVAVEHVRRERPLDAVADLAVDARGVGVQGEEVPRVPQRQEDLAGGVAQPGGGDREVGAAQDRRGEQVPAHRVGAVAVEHLHRVRVVAQALGHLQAVVAEDDAVADARAERRAVEQRRGQARAACRTSRASGRCTRR